MLEADKEQISKLLEIAKSKNENLQKSSPNERRRYAGSAQKMIHAFEPEAQSQ